MTRTVLVDGDIVLYRCGFAAEHTDYLLIVGDMKYKFDGKRSMNQWLKDHSETVTEYSWSTELRIEPLNFVLGTTKRMIANIKKGCDADVVEIYLSDKKNFRHDLATIAKYKGNRDKKRAPLHIKDIREYMINVHGAKVWANHEADDVLAVRQLKLTAEGKDTVIASIDKDLLQIPGKHYDFVKDTKIMVTDDTALRKKLHQMLTGDKTDNIPGIYLVGPIKAAKLLADCKTETEMRDVIYTAWDAYLLSDKKPPEWLVDYDGMNCVIYTDWHGNEIETALTSLIKEIESLITVGEQV